MNRRGFLTTVAAGVAAALAPNNALPSNASTWLPAVAPPIGAVMSHDGADFKVQMNGTVMMWQQMMRDYEQAEQIAARIGASAHLSRIDIMLDAETP